MAERDYELLDDEDCRDYAEYHFPDLMKTNADIVMAVFRKGFMCGYGESLHYMQEELTTVRESVSNMWEVNENLIDNYYKGKRGKK